MFLHSLKYELKVGLRNKELIIWLMIFPIVLGTFFKIAFGNIYSSETVSAIPVAVVENVENEIFDGVMTTVSGTDESLFKAVYTDGSQAGEMLENGEVSGIIYVDEDGLSMGVADTAGVEQSIIESFVRQYTTRESVIKEAVKKNPMNITAAIEAMNISEDMNSAIPLTDGNTDVYIQYFYNLIAMVGMFGSMTGLHIAIENQANLSASGARNNVSPVNKLTKITAGLLGSFIEQTVCVIIAASYVAFVLGVDFGSRLPLVYLSGILGGCAGVSMGFFVGSIGTMSLGAKTGLSMSVSMICCALSGLMVGDIKPVIAEHAPIINKINPAAVISDSFYCLNLYRDYDKYIEKIVTLLVIIVLFTVGGFLMIRRKKYASL
ncbi:MAG: ABC transporter permease [Alistipes sp.]|nr:ABC transporter permease [Alistipes sp.]